MDDILRCNVRIVLAEESLDDEELEPRWLYTDTRRPNGMVGYIGGAGQRRITAPFTITTDDITTAGEYATIDENRRATLRERVAVIEGLDARLWGSAYITNDADVDPADDPRWFLHRMRPYYDRVQKTVFTVYRDPNSPGDPYSYDGVFECAAEALAGVSGGRPEDPPDDPGASPDPTAVEGAEPDYTQFEIAFDINGRERRSYTTRFSATIEVDGETETTVTARENFEAGKAAIYTQLGLSSDGGQGPDGFTLTAETTQDEVEVDSGNNGLWVQIQSMERIVATDASVKSVDLSLALRPSEGWNPDVGGTAPFYADVSGTVQFDVARSALPDVDAFLIAEQEARELVGRNVSGGISSARIIAGSMQSYDPQAGVVQVSYRYQVGNTTVLSCSRSVNIVTTDDVVYSRDGAGDDMLQVQKGNIPTDAIVTESIMQIGSAPIGMPAPPPLPGWASAGSVWHIVDRNAGQMRRNQPMSETLGELVVLTGGGDVLPDVWEQTYAVRYRLLRLAAGQGADTPSGGTGSEPQVR